MLALITRPSASGANTLSTNDGNDTVNVSHTAATPPGFTVTVKGRLEKIDGRKLSFAIEARDGVDTISKGSHDRFIIDAGKFNAGVAKKKASI